ncbi:hypothetical protein COHA_008858 [Chlorella ohadii]|uniref:Prephenate/arogenate dehydrogenase domain-containing protein n=1 Tax=Chlorella ohadii TaxID=2649997 RepID=A0AAD5DJ81_9CHLO|nr:hypothetical protein COHA_008858 [Chlorella ohadii]
MRASRSAGGPGVVALDAAFPFDREAKLRARHSQQPQAVLITAAMPIAACCAPLARQTRLKIGIVGFGTFGQFLAKRMVQAGHEVIATSRSPYHDIAAQMGVAYFTDADDFCEEHPEVVILATSILSTESVLAALPVQRLKRSTLFVDVLSVKEFPKRLLLRVLPPEVDILCTHPMFGPDSGKGSWSGLNFQFERVRIGADPERQRRCDAFLQFFEREGCRMVEMSCEEHDQLAASTQFITHTVGRTLGAMQLQATPIDTKGFQSLLSLVDLTANDSFELYYGLFMYNQNSTEQLDRLEKAFDEVKARLLGQLHDKVRQQIFKGELYEDRRAAIPSHNGSSSSSGSGSNGGASTSANTSSGTSSGTGSGSTNSAASSKGEAVENEWREHLVPATTAGTQQAQHEAAATSGGAGSSESGTVSHGGAEALAGAMPHIHADAQAAGSSDSP